MSIFFFLIFLYSIFISKDVNFIFIFISLFFIFSALFFKSILKIPNQLWFHLGIFLGKIISPIIMLLIYIVTFIPTGIVFKLLKKDLIKSKFDYTVTTYWQEKEEMKSSMKNQF